MDLENAKTYLQSINGADNVSLYDHLSSVLVEIVQQRPEGCVDVFEQLSARVKSGPLLALVKDEKPQPQNAEEAARVRAAIETVAALLKPPRELDEDGEEMDPVEHVEVPDIVAALEQCEWAGVQLGRETVHQLALSIQNLATARELESVRFFGKFTGRDADYFVVEAKLAEDPEEDEDEDETSEDVQRREPYGEGLNEYVYFACNTPTSEWTQLPLVVPNMIQLARHTRRRFTGNLNAPVFGFPRFPYGEAAYLRTQIARIAASTTVCPTDVFLLEEDEAEPILNDEYVPPPTHTLASADRWVHARPFILRQGRVTAFEDPELEDLADDEMTPEQLEARDRLRESPPTPLLPLSRDTSPHADVVWAVRRHDHGQQLSSHGAVSVRSLLWPGAVTVASNGTYTHVYVGDGQPHRDAAYTPPAPLRFQDEYRLPNNAAWTQQPDAARPADYKSEVDEDDDEDSDY